jgi:hypothetical protein
MISAILAGLRPGKKVFKGITCAATAADGEIPNGASPPDPRWTAVVRDMFSTVACDRPRLMATKSAIARTKQLLRDDTTARKKWREKIAERADLMLGLPSLTLTPTWKHDPQETGAAPLPLVEPPQSANGSAAPRDIARLFCLRIQTLV